MLYSLKYNGIISSDMQVLIKERPDIPAPLRRYEKIEVAGRDGSLIESDGSYDDISIPVTFNYMTREDTWFEVFRNVKKWLHSDGEKELVFQDDPDYFFKVKMVEIGTNERTSLRVGNFTATFLCDPFHYAVSGKDAIELSGSLFNHFDVSHPVYKISGNGSCDLTVNNRKVSSEIEDYIVIDTDRMISYKDNIPKNTSIKGNYSDLYLVPGANDVAVSDGFSVSIIPNWRCL